MRWAERYLHSHTKPSKRYNFELVGIQIIWNSIILINVPRRKTSLDGSVYHVSRVFFRLEAVMARLRIQLIGPLVVNYTSSIMVSQSMTRHSRKWQSNVRFSATPLRLRTELIWDNMLYTSEWAEIKKNMNEMQHSEYKSERYAKS